MDPIGYSRFENSLDPMIRWNISNPSTDHPTHTPSLPKTSKIHQKTMFIEACAGIQEVSLGSFGGLRDNRSLYRDGSIGLKCLGSS